ncbi:hypothetical protein DCAR_0519596 [Daucus carota subsp. sativus]|uniref:Uncharacterized protein n=1 Tax=Daucus carota subsp. sativus TaxID=79200 RepID=A0A161ZZM1_DAUCS|nr:hypothetical protein DCAR_0519596 [Daucus carota subsp. sativus]
MLMTEITGRLGEKLLKLIINTLRTESLYYKKPCNEAQHHSPQRDVDTEVEPPDEEVLNENFSIRRDDDVGLNQLESVDYDFDGENEL